MNRFYRLIVAVFVLACMLAGCKGNTEGEATGSDSYGQTITGGKAQPDIELSEVLLEKDEDGKQTITLIFSDRQGNPATSVPEYTLKALEGPCRLRLDIAITDMDADLPLQPGEGSDVCGIFARDAATLDARRQIYIQMQAPYPYQTSEDEGKLSIILSPAEATNDEKYYAYIDAFENFRYDAMPPGTTELAPTLCEDTRHIVLISKPFDEQAEAEAEARRIQNIFDNESANKKRVATVVGLKGGSRPQHYSDSYDEEVANIKPVLMEREERSLPVVMLGGRYLCSSSDGMRLFADGGLRQEGEDRVIPEQLVILDADDRLQRISSLTEIYSIEKAAFSPDDSGIGILAGDGGTGVLYYYSLENKELINISGAISDQDGTNGEVYGFAFGDNGKIYASGSQLYEVEIKEGSCEAIPVIQDSMATGDTRFANGKIYYSIGDYSHEDAGSIFRVSPRGERDIFAEGSRISVSPDGSKLAAIYDYYSENGEYGTSVTIYDTETGGSQEIDGLNTLSGCTWSVDSASFYYGNTIADGDYPIMLTRFDIKSGEHTELMGILTGEFYCIDEDSMYVVMSHRQGNYTVTYKLRLDD